MRLSPVESIAPLQRAMAALGHDASPWALVEGCGGDLSLSGFARCAREHGLEANVLRVSAGDLAYVRAGAIVEFDDESMATVVAHHPRVVVVEGTDGKRRYVSADSEPAPVRALEIGPPPRSVRFFDRLVGHVREDPHFTRAVVLATFLALVLVALGVAGPLLTRLAFGAALPDRAPNQLLLIAGGVVVVGVHIVYAGTVRRAALLYLSMKLSERASSDLFGHMLRLPLATLRGMDVGDVRQAIHSASSAAESLPNTLGPHVVDAVLGSSFLVLTFILDPASGACAALVGALLVGGGYVIGRRRLGLKRTLLQRRRTQQQVLYETFAGIETVKSENVEGRMLAKWLDRVLAEEQASIALRFDTSTFGTLVDFMERVAFTAVLLFAAKRCLNGAGSIADLVAAVQASTSFMVSAAKLARLPGALADYRGDREEVEAILRRPTERDSGARRAPNLDAPALVVRDVWFRYDDDAPWVIVGINLVAHAGERLILAWPSGAGKSTLLRVLAGLVPPTRGDVLLFGSEASRSRRLVTYIPQQANLFEGSLMENLRILSGNARGERILAAAEATGLSEMISNWGMGMETVLSSAVVNISSGQRQLIIFTAAVASEAPIVLLDEALAHMDLDMRARVGAHDLFRDRTVISVVHDASKADGARGRLVTLEAVRAPVPLLGS